VVVIQVAVVLVGIVVEVMGMIEKVGMIKVVVVIEVVVVIQVVVVLVGIVVEVMGMIEKVGMIKVVVVIQVVVVIGMVVVIEVVVMIEIVIVIELVVVIVATLTMMVVVMGVKMPKEDTMMTTMKTTDMVKVVTMATEERTQDTNKHAIRVQEQTRRKAKPTDQKNDVAKERRVKATNKYLHIRENSWMKQRMMFMVIICKVVMMVVTVHVILKYLATPAVNMMMNIPTLYRIKMTIRMPVMLMVTKKNRDNPHMNLQKIRQSLNANIQECKMAIFQEGGNKGKTRKYKLIAL